jgi:hypothetical protein
MKQSRQRLRADQSKTFMKTNYRPVQDEINHKFEIKNRPVGIIVKNIHENIWQISQRPSPSGVETSGGPERPV